MRIILITTLYPGYKNQSRMEKPYAVHYFAKEWSKKHDVTVYRLWNYYPKIFNLSKYSKRTKKYNFKEKFKLDNVNVFRIPSLKIPKLDYSKKIINKAAINIMNTIENQRKPDIIICDILNPSIYIGEILAKRYKSKLIASLHNSDIRYLSNSKKRERFTKMESQISKIALRSNSVEYEFNKLFKNHSINKKTFKILFGINKDEIIGEKLIQYKINKKNTSIVIAASLIKLKNVDILIKAFSKVNYLKQGKYNLRIVGDGPEKEKLQNLVEDLGINKNVEFYGEKSREETLKIMEESDVFAMVSSPETFGLVYIEAMGKGCITIGSKNEGIDGVIEDGKNGYLCNPRDVEKLEVILRHVLSLDSKSKRNILENSIKTAKNLTNKNLAEKYLKEIQK